MSNQSIIEHKANMYYVHLREDYLTICMQCQYKKVVKGGKPSKASPHCKALMLDILEHWTNTKRDQERSFAINMTHQQWIDAMYGMFGRNVIIDSLDELVGEGLVLRETYKTARGGKPLYRYRLNYQEVNRRMKDLPDRSPLQTEPEPAATFTNQPCDEEQCLQVNGQGGKVNDATVTSKPSSCSATLKSKPFIDYINSNKDSAQIESKVENTPGGAETIHTHISQLLKEIKVYSLFPQEHLELLASLPEPIQQQYAYWCHVEQNQGSVQKIHKKAIAHLQLLAECCHSQGDLDDLTAFARQKVRKQLQDETIYRMELGNLCNHVNEWKHLQAERAKQADSPSQLPNTLDGSYRPATRHIVSEKDITGRLTRSWEDPKKQKLIMRQRGVAR